MISAGLNHVAMSFPAGALSTAFRDEVRRFYGELLGRTEIDELELPDPMTLAAGGGTYVNLRERAEAMVCHGDEHLGVTVRSAEDADGLWSALAELGHDVELSELDRGADGFRSFRFRHLLPMAVEVQFFPTAS
jgi:hypothetical protein